VWEGGCPLSTRDEAWEGPQIGKLHAENVTLGAYFCHNFARAAGIND